MVDFLGMMKKAEEMKARMSEMQESLGSILVEGSSGGGMVTVTLTAKGDMRGLKIDPSLFRDDDVAVLEDLVIAAHAEARGKAEAAAAAKMQDIAAGLGLPAGMKLPF